MGDDPDGPYGLDAADAAAPAAANVVEPDSADKPDDVNGALLPGEGPKQPNGRRLSKVDSAIDTIRKSWDDFSGKEVEMTILGTAGRKAKVVPLVPLVPLLPRAPQEKEKPWGSRRSSATLWDLRDARASLTSPKSSVGIKVYRRRWLMLAIFLMVGITNTFQWVQYSIIANVVQRYYGVSSLAVDMTCMSYLIAYLVFFIPASWFLDKWGLRWTLILSAGVTVLGSWVKVGSVAQDRFWLTMVGQWVVAIGQVFMLFLAPKLAAVWFGSKQVSLACSIGFIGILAGNAIGMVLPPLLVPNSEDLSQVAADLRSMFLGVAACTTATLVLQLALFQDQPPLPPSPAQQLQRRRLDEQSPDFWGSLRRILRSRQLQLLLAAWSLNVGVFCAVNTLLTQIVLPSHPDSEAQIGLVGLIMITSGILGSAMCGVFLDRTHRFKLTTNLLNVITLLGWVVFTFLLEAEGFLWIYITVGVYGFATTALQPVGMEFAAEMTFPEPEATAAAIMCSVVQVVGLALTLASGWLLEAAGPRPAMLFLCAPLVLACIVMAFMRPRLKRQEAHRATLVPASDISPY